MLTYKNQKNIEIMIEKKKLNENDFTSEKEYEIFTLNTRSFGSLIRKGSSTNENIDSTRQHKCSSNSWYYFCPKRSILKFHLVYVLVLALSLRRGAAQTKYKRLTVFSH